MAKVENDRRAGRSRARSLALAPPKGHGPLAAGSNTSVAAPPALPWVPADEATVAHRMTISPAHKSTLLLAVLQVVLDALMISAAFALAYRVRLESDIIPYKDPAKPELYIFMIGMTVLTMLVVFAASGLYSLRRGTSRIDEFYKIIAAVAMGTFGAIGVNYLLLADDYVFSRAMLGLGGIFCVVLVAGERTAFAWAAGQARKRGFSPQRILIVGTGEIAQAIIRRVSEHPDLGVRVVGVVEPPRATEERAVWDTPILGPADQVARIARDQRADEVIVAMAGASYHELLEIVDTCADVNVGIKVYPDAFQLITERVDVGELSGVKLVSVKDVALRGWNRLLKRAFDIVFSMTVLIITAPLMMLLAVLIKLDSPGPVFFVQERVGLDGQPIQVIKFRSMRVGSDRQQGGWTTKDDPRRTRLGRWLRRFSLDELPQFINVLLGEMSVVGPRPEQQVYVQQFSRTIPKYMRRHREKAGITGWAQVNGLRGDTSIEERTRLDLEYVETWSLLLDLKIIARTVMHMIRGSNAY
jgi:Undecaprenyl-phosphate glucose phosphotransferase